MHKTPAWPSSTNLLYRVRLKLNHENLNQPAKVATLRRLQNEGLLSEEAYTTACSIIKPATAWFAWVRKTLLLLGSTLVLAGIIFFFAYNWEAMGRFLKFVLLEAAIIGCAIASMLSLKKLSGKMLLMSAAVLCGVLLAVYGQVYQTGADSYELFASWAALIIGWVIVSQFAALWVFWFSLLNIGLILYWQQVGFPVYGIGYEYLCLSLAVINGGALALREAALQEGLEWLIGGWIRAVLLSAVLIPLSLPTIGLIIGDGHSSVADLFTAILWIIVSSTGYKYYRYKLPDMIPLALIVTNTGLIALTLIGKFLFYDAGSGGAGLFLVFGLSILAVVSGAVFWLRKTALVMAGEEKVKSQ